MPWEPGTHTPLSTWQHCSERLLWSLGAGRLSHWLWLGLALCPVQVPYFPLNCPSDPGADPPSSTDVFPRRMYSPWPRDSTTPKLWGEKRRHSFSSSRCRPVSRVLSLPSPTLGVWAFCTHGEWCAPHAPFFASGLAAVPSTMEAGLLFSQQPPFLSRTLAIL